LKRKPCALGSGSAVDGGQRGRLRTPREGTRPTNFSEVAMPCEGTRPTDFGEMAVPSEGTRRRGDAHDRSWAGMGRK